MFTPIKEGTYEVAAEGELSGKLLGKDKKKFVVSYARAEIEDGRPRTDLLTRLTGRHYDLFDYQDQYMTWDQLRAISASEWITIGAHTHNHILLNSVSGDIVHAEATTCRALLEQQLNRPVRHFSR